MKPCHTFGPGSGAAPAGERPAPHRRLRLISHHLCPYVQRAVIALTEKTVPHERVYIDLAEKPDWFLALSPLGRVPVLQVGEAAVFESAVIVEYLEETTDRPLHPTQPLQRAVHRAWMEFASATLDTIAGLYNAPAAEAFDRAQARLRERLGRLEQQLGEGPYFDGDRFHLVDAAWGPVFRYFDTMEALIDLQWLRELPRLNAYRRALAARPSVRDAVPAGYPERLRGFLARRGSHLSRLMAAEA